MNPFDVLNSVNHNKKDILDAENEKHYPAFMVNRGLSYFRDTVLLANEMNRNHHLDGRLQFDFLRNAIRARKRFSKWAKKAKMDNIDVIKEAYGYSTAKAEAVSDLFTQQDIDNLSQKLSKGGKR